MAWRLFDIHSATEMQADVLGESYLEIPKLWRTKQLEYSWGHSLMGRYVDFGELTKSALDYALTVHGILDDRVAVLSDGSPTMLNRLSSRQVLKPCLTSACRSRGWVSKSRTERPTKSPRGRLGVTPDQIAFFSSNARDAIGAHTFGFRVFWMNRSGHPGEYGLPRWVTLIPGLEGAFRPITDYDAPKRAGRQMQRVNRRNGNHAMSTQKMTAADVETSAQAAGIRIKVEDSQSIASLLTQVRQSVYDKASALPQDAPPAVFFDAR